MDKNKKKTTKQTKNIMTTTTMTMNAVSSFPTENPWSSSPPSTSCDSSPSKEVTSMTPYSLSFPCQKDYGLWNSPSPAALATTKGSIKKTSIDDLKSLFKKVYGEKIFNDRFDKLKADELIKRAFNLRDGVPFASVRCVRVIEAIVPPHFNGIPRTRINHTATHIYGAGTKLFCNL